MAVSHAVGAVALGVVGCVALVVAGWASDPASATPWPQVVRLGVDLWLVAHLGELAVVSEVVTSTSPSDPPTVVMSTLSLAPIGVAVAMALLSRRVGRRIALRCAPVRALLLCLAVALIHAGAAWLLAWAVDTRVVAPAPAACAIGAGVLAAAGSTLGVLSIRGRDLLDRLPRSSAMMLRRVLPAAGVAGVGWLGAGALLLTAGLLLGIADVTAVHTALAPGLLGAVLLLLLQVVYLPSAVVWAAAVLAGPGVWLGTGSIDLLGSDVTGVPAVPLLAALPDPGSSPVWAYLGPVVVIAAGALAGWHAHRHPSSVGATLLDRLLDAVAIAGLVGIGSAAAALLVSGTLGPWGPLGPDLLLLVAAVTGEVLLGALMAGGALHLLSGRPISRARPLSRARPTSRARPLSPSR